MKQQKVFRARQHQSPCWLHLLQITLLLSSPEEGASPPTHRTKQGWGDKGWVWDSKEALARQPGFKLWAWSLIAG